MTRRLLPLLLASAALVSGCAAAGGVPETSDTPRRDLAETPSSLAPTAPATNGGHQPGTPNGSPSASTDPGTSGSTSPGTAPSAGGADRGDGNSIGDPAPTGPFRTFATMTDGRSDAGLSTPAYGDLRSVTMQTNGVDLRVTVTVDGTLPQHIGADEVMGIGVDLYPQRRQRESDYQLFVDGEPGGWFAYLQTPRGFVRYPGTFALGGNRLVFTVPLSSIGSPAAGRFSAFVDWSRKSSGLTGNKAGNDYAPTLGTKAYAR